MDQRSKAVRELIADNDVTQALKQLGDLATAVGSNDDQNETLLLKRELAELQRDQRQRTTPDQDLRIRERQLLYGALKLFNFLETRSAPQEPVVPAPDPRTTSIESTAPAFQKIIGVNNLKEIAWLTRGLVAARSVCRILTPRGTGTGFLIGPRRVMTNNHVIPSADDALKARIEFNYELSESPTVRYDLNPAGFFKTSSRFELDYTVVEVTAPKGDHAVPLEQWGSLLLNPTADPFPDEHVVIVQHPNGQPKQIALTANAVLRTEPPLLHYSTDTMSGSSGSPVFNDLWQVVAIHHREGPDIKANDGTTHHTNEGILMSAIVPDLGAGWR